MRLDDSNVPPVLSHLSRVECRPESAVDEILEALFERELGPPGAPPTWAFYHSGDEGDSINRLVHCRFYCRSLLALRSNGVGVELANEGQELIDLSPKLQEDSAAWFQAMAQPP